MKSYTLMWAVLAIVGLYGALMYSAVFFGLFTVSLFLIFYSRGGADKAYNRVREENTPTLTPQPANVAALACPNCGMVLEAGASFCTRCGARVSKE